LLPVHPATKSGVFLTCSRFFMEKYIGALFLFGYGVYERLLRGR
jgi:hypothetical protein